MGEALKGKIAVVTGAGRGLGKAFALAFAQEGATLVLPDISLERAEQTATLVREGGGEATVLEVDISEEGSTLAVAEKVRSVHGHVDVLLNNAALSYGIAPRQWDAWTVEEWDAFFGINTRGTWLMCKAIAPMMVEAGRGKIINVASDIGRLAPSQGLLPYACSKAAIIQITQALARALGPSGICVNSLAPGLTATEAALMQPESDRLFDETVAVQCIKRRGVPEDLVGAAVFLASDAADMVTGQLLIVDGGAAFV